MSDYSQSIVSIEKQGLPAAEQLSKTTDKMVFADLVRTIRAILKVVRDGDFVGKTCPPVVDNAVTTWGEVYRWMMRQKDQFQHTAESLALIENARDRLAEVLAFLKEKQEQVKDTKVRPA